MHCILNYPTKNFNANLKMIEDLKKFPNIIGYSDHTLPSKDIFHALSLINWVLELLKNILHLIKNLVMIIIILWI